MASSEDSGEHPRLSGDQDGEQDGDGVAPEAAPGPPDEPAPQRPRNPPLLDEPEFQRFGRVIKIFIWPFFFSWAVAFAGSARGLDWLHFTGLGGVGLCMVALLVWLIS